MKFLVHCEQPNCYMHMTVNTEEEQAHYLANHKCPYWGGESKVSWSVTKTLVQQMWGLLDDTMDELKMAAERDDRDFYRTRARALAECIAIFMTPFFESADDIAREANKRWKARSEGDTEYETPGLGIRRYESAAQAHLSATPGWYGTAQDGYSTDSAMAGSPSRNRGRGAPVRAANAASAAPVVVSDKDKAAMKMAYEGMPQIFTPATLAKQYNVPLSVVKEIVGA